MLVESSAVAIPGLLAVAFPGRLGENRSHSKAFVVWNSEDVLAPLLFQNLRGLSSFFRNPGSKSKKSRLVEG